MCEAGEYFKRAEVAGVLDRLDRWITRRLRAYLAKRWRNGGTDRSEASLDEFFR
jgi:EAL domain-containing protein (putative c-di-GMP-specific phosphodiesterase class I)